MTLKPLASWGTLLVLLSVLVITPGTASAASPPVEAAIKMLANIPADTAKFAAYCNLLGEMESVPDTDAAKYEALEDQLDDIIESYGADVLQAWNVLSETDAETDDGKSVSAAFEELEAKCP